jgi:hypothetical protein
MSSQSVTLENPHDASKAYFPCRQFGMAEFDAAPYRYVTSVELPCTPEALFDVFEDPVSWTYWAVGIKKVEWTSPRPFGAGTTRTVTFADGTEVYERFIAWDRGRELAFVLEGHSNEIWHSFGERYRVRDLGNGRCHFEWTVCYEPRGPFAKAHPWVKPVMSLAFKVYLYRLKLWCKRHARGWGTTA